MKHLQIHPLSILAGAGVTAVAFALAGMQLTTTATAFLTPQQLEFLSHISMVDLPDGVGGFTQLEPKVETSLQGSVDRFRQIIARGWDSRQLRTYQTTPVIATDGRNDSIPAHS